MTDSKEPDPQRVEDLLNVIKILIPPEELERLLYEEDREEK